MKIIKAGYEILTPIDGDAILKRIERAGRVCYKSEERITETSAAKFVASIINRGHESVLEHENITFRFVFNRGISHEAVRHRHTDLDDQGMVEQIDIDPGVSQESTRYCDYDNGEITFINPCWMPDVYLWNNQELMDAIFAVRANSVNMSANGVWLSHMAACEKAYGDLRRLGWPPERAREVLPIATKTECVLSMSLRELRLFLRLRTAKPAHLSMREVCVPFLDELKSLIPIVFDDIIPYRGE